MRALLLLCLSVLMACGPSEEEVVPEFTRAELMDPNTCMDCHPAHVQEWEGSMHAYASEDPLFVAMNARGQRETDGELGDFCVQCHAPMAVREGATTDGLNLEDVDDTLQGVSCYFCHNTQEVHGDSNAELDLANDLVMRGGYDDPTPNTAHASAYSPLMDRNQIESSSACGACHDVVTPSGVELERTFMEWKETLFAKDIPGMRQTCGNCHMDGRDDVAADYDGVPLRRVHAHGMPGVDIAITDFPDQVGQREAVERLLDTSLFTEMHVCDLGGAVEVTLDLENIASGHSWPSGAAHDRRAWVELVAYEGDEVVYTSGLLAADQALTDLEDPNLWRMGDIVTDDEGHEVHMFWDVRHVQSQNLPAPTTFDPTDPDWIQTHLSKRYLIDDASPDRVTSRVFIRPVGLDLIADLEASGDLEPGYAEKIPTFELQSTVLEWTIKDGYECGQ
jgi:hypothetical protein